MASVSVLSTLLVTLAVATAAKQPNIVFFLTDDQDQMLGGSFPIKDNATPMTFTHQEFVGKGAMATNFFIHTPICCPSRSETLTGRYLHNVKIFNNVPGRAPQCPEGYNGEDDQGNTCCMHVDEELVNNFTMATHLKAAGYTVGMFGKYLNNCPDADHVPPGYDAWFANGGGTYYSPQFAVKNIDGYPDGSFQGNKSVYSTSIIGNVSLAWINKVGKNTDVPFFAYIGSKACHEPFLPAPWYQTYWDPSWPTTAPRPPSFNISYAARANHHPTIQMMEMLTDKTVQCIDETFSNRWRTLMSVDDIIREVFAAVENMGLMDNTYFLYSSDHGFQLGELNLPMDKRNVYDFDIRIHMLARGPGIKAGSTWSQLASNVDIAPTILDIAGIANPGLDGRSFLPLISTTKTTDVATTWRDSMFVEYYYVGIDGKCGMSSPIERPDNNFIGIRFTNSSKYGNLLYAEFQNGTDGWVDFKTPDFHEVYDLDADPWQLNNLYKTFDQGKLSDLHDTIHQWLSCKGESCF
eukprot:m.260648 g.260648  ORF g.260648 m.260648 type:complete len:521 (-) comp40388_c0_seq1:488-2050(-)